MLPLRRLYKTGYEQETKIQVEPGHILGDGGVGGVPDSCFAAWTDPKELRFFQSRGGNQCSAESMADVLLL